jgi:hypothetical protein
MNVKKCEEVYRLGGENMQIIQSNYIHKISSTLNRSTAVGTDQRLHYWYHNLWVYVAGHLPSRRPHLGRPANVQWLSAVGGIQRPRTCGEIGWRACH